MWRPPSLSELTPINSNMELTHLGSETFISLSRFEELILSETISNNKLDLDIENSNIFIKRKENYTHHTSYSFLYVCLQA